MWLLDHNIPRQIVPVLQRFGIEVDTTAHRGWAELRNGELLGTASKAGFTCILTKDVLFREDAAKALKLHPNIAIVHITLPQLPGKQYAEEFARAWAKLPINPVCGSVIDWP